MDITSYMLGKKAGGGTITETDPIFSQSAAAGITSQNIEKWNNMPVFFMDGDYTSSTPLIADDLKIGIYSFHSPLNQVYIKPTENSENIINFPISDNELFVISKEWKDVSNNSAFLTSAKQSIQKNLSTISCETRILKKVINSSTQEAELSNDVVASGSASNLEFSNRASTITVKKTFNTLPESSVVPTTDNQLVNKKYVDDSIATAITSALGGSY